MSDFSGDPDLGFPPLDSHHFLAETVTLHSLSRLEGLASETPKSAAKQYGIHMLFVHGWRFVLY